MIQRIISPQTGNVPDLIEELQRSDQGQAEAPLVETRPVLFSKGDVVALKHNWRCYLEPFFLAILHEDLHGSSDGFLESTMQLNWLEPSEEDPLVYVIGNEDNELHAMIVQNFGKMAVDRAMFL